MSYVKRLEDLVQCLIDNDPEDLAADGGIRVIDVWRKDAERALHSQAKKAKDAISEYALPPGMDAEDAVKAAWATVAQAGNVEPDWKQNQRETSRLPRKERSAFVVALDMARDALAESNHECEHEDYCLSPRCDCPAQAESKPVPAGYIDQPWRDSSWVGLSASERACYEWPEDNDLHKQCRAAYIAGATDYAAPAPLPFATSP